MKKEDIELAAFESFLHLSGKSFDRYQSANPPEPDLVAWCQNEKFGIEVTNFHRRLEKTREGEQDKIIDLACQYYEAMGGTFIDVSVCWAPRFEVARKDRDRLARKLAALASANVPPLRSLVNLDWRSFEPELIQAVDHVAINRLIDYKRNTWHAAGGGIVPDWEQETLQNELNRKNGKPAKYRDNYAEVWLLIVSVFGAPSSWMEMTDAARNATYQSAFNRVFLLSSFPLAVFELQVRT